jgi:hypothetical protein
MFTDSELKKQDIDQLKRKIRAALDGYQIATKDIRAGNRLYRGVRRVSRPDKIGQVSYPPQDAVTSLGRVNRIGEPRFYCYV